MEAQFHLVPENNSESEHDSSASDCESNVSSSTSAASTRRKLLFPENLAVEVAGGEAAHELIRRRFLSCLGPIGEKATVVAIHRKTWSGFCNQARIQSFQIHSKAVANKNGGSSNVKFAWFGHGKERIMEILSRGFGYTEVQDNIHGAVFLSPDSSPAESIEGSVPDEDGIRHVLLCRVILGRPELVPPGSDLTHPTSDEFDSGVDRFENPSKYVIWSTAMNTHILPEYVISFRAPDSSPSRGPQRRFPTSPWIPFPTLLAVLERFLAPDCIALLRKYHSELKERMITREELVRRLRQVVGDKLLLAIIRSCNKGAKVSSHKKE
uniref:NAD(+) ADP-ribosyltransferase n=1 Tax=Opuntia streptacantha TaxID=393608 RepID=A0A7C9A579_OPUST